jgi:hypothetical protein
MTSFGLAKLVVDFIYVWSPWARREGFWLAKETEDAFINTRLMITGQRLGLLGSVQDS